MIIMKICKDFPKIVSINVRVLIKSVFIIIRSVTKLIKQSFMDISPSSLTSDWYRLTSKKLVVS